MSYKLLKEIFKLDTNDLNWDISSEKINQLSLTSSGKYGLFEGVLRLLYHLSKSILYLKASLVISNSEVLLFSGTKNQSLALEKLKFDSVTKHIKFGNQSNKFKNNSYELYPYLLSLLFIPVFIFNYFTESSKFKRKIMLCRLDRYLFSYGLCFFFYMTLNPKKTKLVIMSNDHSVWQRSLLHIAALKNVKTAYVQHANVSPLFPKLTFDYAFLDGNYAKNTYKVGNCKVFMVGCLRFEDIIDDSRIEYKKTKVLLCFNRIDSKKKISEVINFFIKAKIAFDVRLHPAEHRKDLIKIISESEGYEDVTSSNLSNILKTYTYCFSGTSSIFLEASLCGLKCFSIDDLYDDYYGFQKDGIVKVFPNLSSIDLQAIESTANKSRFLYHCSDTEVEHLIYPSKRIKHILENDGVI